MTPAEVFYFGCENRRIGHNLFGPGMRSVSRMLYERGIPWGTQVDGRVQPARSGRHDRNQGYCHFKQGEALVSHLDGWTALGFWDNSVDTRPASCSAFVAQGTHDFAAMVALAQQAFPEVWARFTFPIVDVTARVRAEGGGAA